MNRKDDWYESTYRLRNLLYELPVGNRRETIPVPMNPYHYKFGVTLCDRNGAWYIYNLKTDNVIATVKRGNGRVIIRYRENSVYSYILGRYKYDCPTVHVKSPNLRRRAAWVRDRLRSRLREHYRSVRANFLAESSRAQPGQSHTMVFPYLSTTQPAYYGATESPLGLHSQGPRETRIVFDSPPTGQLQDAAVTMMRYLSRNPNLLDASGLEIPEEMTYEYLRTLYERVQSTSEGLQEEAETYDQMGAIASAAGLSHSSWRTSAMERAMQNANPAWTIGGLQTDPQFQPESDSIQEEMNRLVRERLERMARETTTRSPQEYFQQQWAEYNDSEGSDDV